MKVGDHDEQAGTVSRLGLDRKNSAVIRALFDESLSQPTGIESIVEVKLEPIRNNIGAVFGSGNGRTRTTDIPT